MSAQTVPQMIVAMSDELVALRDSYTQVCADNKALGAELKLTTLKVLTCGVAASHPDPALSSREKDYGGPWDSPQAQAVRALRAERDALREALIAMRDWFGVDPQAKSQLDQWEDLAEEFYRETGFLRPGKDYPAAAGNPEEREEQRNTAWRIWADVKKGQLLAQVRAALARSQP